MLSLNDFRNLIENNKKEFKVIINDIEYQCNLQSLKIFSKEIYNFIQQNPTATEYKTNIEAKQENIASVISFINGKQDCIFSDLIEVYFVGATLNIDSIRRKLQEQVCKLVTIKNYDVLYYKFLKYPKFLFPVFNFFSQNNELFNNFFKLTAATTEVIIEIFNFNPPFFESEDLKLLFLLHQFDISKNPPFELIKMIDFTNIKPLSYVQLIHSPYAKEFEKYISILNKNDNFELIQTILQTQQRFDEINEENEKIRQEYDELYTKISELNEENAKTIQNNQLLISKRTEFKNVIKNAIDKIPTFISLISNIKRQDDLFKSITSNIADLKKLSQEMYNLSDYFYKERFGNILYPGSSKSCYDIAVLWKNSMIDLEQMIDKITPNDTQINQIIDVFKHKLNELQQLSESIVML